MYKKVIVLSVFYLINSLFYLGYSNDLNSKIIPVPDKQIFLDGFFIIDSNTSINYPDQFKNSINFFRTFLNQGKNKFHQNWKRKLNIQIFLFLSILHDSNEFH